MTSWKKIVRKLFLGSAIFAALIVCLGFVLIEPNFRFLGLQNLDQSKLAHKVQYVVLDANDKPIDIVPKNRVWIDIGDVPQHTIDAFVALEDHRFFEHSGFDTARILKALGRNIIERSYKEGASTITQQLAKNTHLTNQKNLRRKLNELRIARELERKLSKHEILEEYFNILYFGNGIYGLGSASRDFFGIPVYKLDLSQSALLAAIINNPKLYSPTQRPQQALERRNLVLDQMKKRNKITPEQCDGAKATPINLIDNDNYLYAMSTMLGWELEKNDLTQNATLHTNIDDNFSQKAYKKITAQKQAEFDISAILLKNSDNSIVSAISTRRDNLALTQRQPGSTLKPIIAYAPAIQSNLTTPMTPILDAKTNFEDYSPKNYNDIYKGWTTVQDALSQSLNIPAVKLLQQNGIEQSKNFARRIGIEFASQDDSLSLALGGMYNGISLLDLTTAYSTFANGGQYQKSDLLQKVSNSTKAYNKIQQKKPAMRQDTAVLTTKMLQKATKTGTAKALKDLPFDVAAKTGTVGTKDGNTDAYCIAYTSKHTLGIWVGGTLPNKITGGNLPCQIANQLLSMLYKYDTPQPFATTDKIVKKYIDYDSLYNYHSLRLAQPYHPQQQKREAYFSVHNPPSPAPLQHFEYKDILDYYKQGH